MGVALNMFWGKAMSEIRVSGVPIPLVNYAELIHSRKSPYYDTV
jgi:hypothetical protein